MEHHLREIACSQPHMEHHLGETAEEKEDSRAGIEAGKLKQEICELKINLI